MNMVETLKQLEKGYLIALVERETDKAIMMMAECATNKKTWFTPVWFPKSCCKYADNQWYVQEAMLHSKVRDLAAHYNHHVCVTLGTAQSM